MAGMKKSLTEEQTKNYKMTEREILKSILI